MMTATAAMSVGGSQRAWLRFRRGDLAHESMRAYRIHLGSVTRTVGADWPCGQWGRPECDRWWQAQDYLAARTLRHRLSCVRQWSQWCVVRDLMACDPTVWLPQVREPRTVPRALTAAQAEAVWAACGDDRARLAVSLMLFEGLRRGEVARLDMADIDRHRRHIRVTGKGRQERTVPLSAATAGLLDGTGRRWGPAVASRTTGGPLTPGYIAEIVQAVLDRAGVDASPHALRHTAASDALESGCPIRAVQRFLGHSTVQSTEIYLRRDVTDLRPAVDARQYQFLFDVED